MSGEGYALSSASCLNSFLLYKYVTNSAGDGVGQEEKPTKHGPTQKDLNEDSQVVISTTLLLLLNQTNVSLIII